MYGPWDRLVAFEPFLGEGEHPEGAGYYPEDLDVDEFEAWIADSFSFCYARNDESDNCPSGSA